MADITEALSQDQIAESLMTPTDRGDQTEGPAGSEAEPETEVQELDAQPQEQIQEENGEDWLPNEQSKVFPQEIIAQYARRYGYTAEQIAADPQLAQVLHDKINSDIYIQQQRQQEQELARQQQQPEQRPTQPQQPVPFAQWQENARQFIRQAGLNNPEVSNAFTQSFMKAFGVENMQGVNPEALTETFTIFGMNLINSLLPQYFQAPSGMDGKNMLQALVESSYQELPHLNERATFGNAWESIVDSNPAFANLPAFGTKEFAQTMRAAADKLPGFDSDSFADMRFSGPDGRPLSNAENNQKKYAILAQVALGNQPNPAMMAKAVETGKRLARQGDVRRTAGNLGAGKSSTQGMPKTPNDDIFAEGLELYRREHGRI